MCIQKYNFLSNTLMGKHLAFNIRSLAPTLQQNITIKKNKKRFLKCTLKFLLSTPSSKVANPKSYLITFRKPLSICLLSWIKMDLFKLKKVS